MGKTIGLHGKPLMKLLYAYGALTRPQIARLTGLHTSAIDRQLRHLRGAGYVERVRDVASWKQTKENAHTAYYLTLPAGAKTAAFLSGIENDVLSLRHYRRIRLPGTVSHRLVGNEYLISIVEAAGAAGVKVEGVSSESCPDFPIFGSGVPRTGRADTGYRFSRIVPDGTFRLDGAAFCLEVETGTHRRELPAKIDDYAGWWRRLLRPNKGERRYHDPSARLEPVVIITPETEAAKKLQKFLRERLPAEEDWAAATKVIGEVSGGRADPRQLVLLAGAEEVRDDPLARVYRPLRRYPDALSDSDGWRVSLRDAAAISDRIPVPKEPPESTLEDEEEEEVA